MSDDKKKKKPGKRKTPAPGTPSPAESKEDISGVFDTLERGGVPGDQAKEDISAVFNTLELGGVPDGSKRDAAAGEKAEAKPSEPALPSIPKPGAKPDAAAQAGKPGAPAAQAGKPDAAKPGGKPDAQHSGGKRDFDDVLTQEKTDIGEPDFDEMLTPAPAEVASPTTSRPSFPRPDSDIPTRPGSEPSIPGVPLPVERRHAGAIVAPVEVAKTQPIESAPIAVRTPLAGPAKIRESAARDDTKQIEISPPLPPSKDAVPAHTPPEPTLPSIPVDDGIDPPTSRLDKPIVPVLIQPRRTQDPEEQKTTNVFKVARPDSEPSNADGVPKRDSEPDGIPKPKIPFETKPFQLQPREPAGIVPATGPIETKPMSLPTKTPASDSEILEADAHKWEGAEKPKLRPDSEPPARASDKVIELTAEPSKSVRLPPGERGLSAKPGVALADKLASAPAKSEATTTTATSTPAVTAAAAASTAALASTATAVDTDEIESETTTEDKSDVELVDWVAPNDGFFLADEIGDSPPPPVPPPPVLASPQEAALEAARIVSQMVDIESESGAMIAAAAAAGAAIEAAAAAQRAQIDPRASQPSMRIPPEVLAGQSSTDPVTTVRLSRDRILAALADEDIAVPVPPSARDSQTSMQRAEPGRIRARTEPGVEEEPYEDFDPVAIAAAAIGRLRARARTDLAELRVHYHKHDVLVLFLALVIIIVAGQAHKYLVTPPVETFKERGLTFEHSTNWLRPEPMPAISPRLVRDPTGGTTKDENLYHVEMAAIGSNAKIEILIDKKPTWSNIVTGLELDRRSRWGELYTLDASSVKSIGGHDWLRTAYRYAHVVDRGDVPRVDRAVEYATIDREQIYVVTIFGSPVELEQIEDVVAPTLKVPSQTGLPLVPQTSRLSQRKYPGPVGRAFESTVMVVAADLVDGRLKARGGGSGVIVGGEGSILTNFHVIHDKDGRLHDVFIIGRFSAPDRAPQLQCAGRPSRSKLSRELDLALIKCDMDLDGRTWSPLQSSIWATLPEARASDVKIGQRLWVLGYPDVGGGGLTLSAGEVEGWTGEDGAQGKDFIKTDASITHGNSGGPVIDDSGRLVGIAAAFRTRVTANNGVIETSQIGLVRPLQTASNLLAYATAGWTPREGYTDVELTPTAVEAAAEGVRIFTTVIDDANEQPVRDATVMVLKAGVDTAKIDMNRLDDQAIAWGKTNALGEVRLKQLVPVPGTYTVMVIAPGYEPLIGDNELKLDDKTPPRFDPWGRIGLRAR